MEACGSKLTKNNTVVQPTIATTYHSPYCISLAPLNPIQKARIPPDSISRNDSLFVQQPILHVIQFLAHLIILLLPFSLHSHSLSATHIMVDDNVLTVCVTGAAGQISYSLLPILVSGNVFGSNQKIRLHLLELPRALGPLSGVVMELQDLAAPLLHSTLETADMAEAFHNADVIVLVGAIPRGKGQARADLLARNAPIFRAQGAAIAKHAKSSVRVLVVGNPANTNAYIISAAGNISPKQITALTQLDANRARSLVARQLDVSVSDVHGVCIWGNHSDTQYPDVTRAEASGRNVVNELGGHAKIAQTFIPTIQKRGKAVIDARGLSSAASAAKAIADHLRAWASGSDEIVSMAVHSDGSYGIDPGVWYSYPVRCKGGFKYEIVQNLQIDDFSRSYLDTTAVELYSERATAKNLLV